MHCRRLRDCAAVCSRDLFLCDEREDFPLETSADQTAYLPLRCVVVVVLSMFRVARRKANHFVTVRRLRGADVAIAPQRCHG